jgi:hypothetical protein
MKRGMKSTGAQPDDAVGSDRFRVGDRVRIVQGREAGKAGIVVQILQLKRGGRLVAKGRYAVDIGSSLRTYCAETDLEPWLP